MQAGGRRVGVALANRPRRWHHAGNREAVSVSRRRRASAAVLVLIGCLAAALPAAAVGRLDPPQVRAMIAAAKGGRIDLAGADLSGDDLTGLDLSGADLRRADLSRARLHGVKLVGADLTEANLAGADLTFAWIIRANFTRADLRGATLQTIVTSTGMDNTADQAATFVGADLSGSNDTVHFSFDDMRGANFSHANMTVVVANQSMGLLRSEFMDSNLDGADFSDAGLGHVSFRFAKLRGARFVRADLSFADFQGAYLDGADFTSAKLDHASFDGASTTGTVGLPPAR